MRPKTGTVALILLMLTIASCANVGRFGQIMNPEVLDKDELKKLPVETTPEYGFRVGMEINVPGHEDEILENVDHQFTEFSECFNITDRGEEARRYTSAVVNGTFRCEYHHWRCNGEYDSDYGLIIVSYKAFNRRGDTASAEARMGARLWNIERRPQELKKSQGMHGILN